MNATRVELRYASAYDVGQLLEVSRGGAREIGLARGQYRVQRITKRGLVEVRGGGQRIRFDPQQLSPTDQCDRLQLPQTRSIYEGDLIRWTGNDKQSGMHSCAVARVLRVERAAITVALADQTSVRLEPGDRMLANLDLAYARNMHVAQGVTTDRAIPVLLSSERHCA